MARQVTQTSWWVAGLGDTLVWSRLCEREDAHAEVLAADGRTLQFADTDTARAALLDAEFVAFDGLDEADAASLGFDLAHITPPSGDSDQDLLPHMTQRLPGLN